MEDLPEHFRRRCLPMQNMCGNYSQLGDIRSEGYAYHGDRVTLPPTLHFQALITLHSAVLLACDLEAGVTTYLIGLLCHILSRGIPKLCISYTGNGGTFNTL